MKTVDQAPVVQRPDTFIRWISHYSGSKIYLTLNVVQGFHTVPNLECAYSFVQEKILKSLHRLIVTYPLDKVIQPLNNWGLYFSLSFYFKEDCFFKYSSQHTQLGTLSLSNEGVNFLLLLVSPQQDTFKVLLDAVNGDSLSSDDVRRLFSKLHFLNCNDSKPSPDFQKVCGAIHCR